MENGTSCLPAVPRPNADEDGRRQRARIIERDGFQAHFLSAIRDGPVCRLVPYVFPIELISASLRSVLSVLSCSTTSRQSQTKIWLALTKRYTRVSATSVCKSNVGLAKQRRDWEARSLKSQLLSTRPFMKIRRRRTYLMLSRKLIFRSASLVSLLLTLLPNTASGKLSQQRNRIANMITNTLMIQNRLSTTLSSAAAAEVSTLLPSCSSQLCSL